MSKAAIANLRVLDFTGHTQQHTYTMHQELYNGGGFHSSARESEGESESESVQQNEKNRRKKNVEAMNQFGRKTMAYNFD